ncbi:hypothetical protein PACILC2_06370 [Paenibacillus cisolokensis]|uniref:Uncharacterized protein n=1 Tax=Paenibacillus cisolokensis TaxID=1658519 RepID=A0ABQ4N1N6_9BACL|nr:hypothetical protein [Paenibacillus cisolokensis]GIQ62069.1 hypothetical protein PACILC2_06370 [Paenibacillus cisolokensis]
MRHRWKDIAFDTVNTCALVCLMIVTLYPFLHVLAYSLNDAVDSMRGDLTFFPANLRCPTTRSSSGMTHWLTPRL